MSAPDVNEGVSIRQHGLGFQVFMYKKRPGEYFNAHGDPVPTVIAGQAGYPTERLERERVLLGRKAAAMDALEREFHDDTKADIIAERGGFRVLHTGYDRYQLQDNVGNAMTTRPMTKAEAMGLFDQFAPAPKPTKGSVSEAPKA